GLARVGLGLGGLGGGGAGGLPLLAGRRDRAGLLAAEACLLHHTGDHREDHAGPQGDAGPGDHVPADHDAHGRNGPGHDPGDGEEPRGDGVAVVLVLLVVCVGHQGSFCAAWAPVTRARSCSAVSGSVGPRPAADPAAPGAGSRVGSSPPSSDFHRSAGSAGPPRGPLAGALWRSYLLLIPGHDGPRSAVAAPAAASSAAPAAATAGQVHSGSGAAASPVAAACSATAAASRPGRVPVHSAASAAPPKSAMRAPTAVRARPAVAATA